MTLKDHRVAVIGCGTMGEAIVKGLRRDDSLPAARIVVSHPRAERRDELADRYGVRAEAGNAAAAADASVVVIAVKPQVMDEVLTDLAGAVASTAVVVTIVAGVRLAHVARLLGVARVVRAMPNTPGQIGRGITVWTATAAVGEPDRAVVRALLAALGAEERVIHENELDMATALSGTGPAYVFLFMEAMVDAGVHLGFSRRVAARLVMETMRGSLEYAAGSADHLAKLRNQVTSPGGTTASAQYQLEKGGLRTVLSDAVWAAYRRCVELGRQVAPDTDQRPYRRE